MLGNSMKCEANICMFKQFYDIWNILGYVQGISEQFYRQFNQFYEIPGNVTTFQGISNISKQLCEIARNPKHFVALFEQCLGKFKFMLGKVYPVVGPFCAVVNYVFKKL